MKTVWNIARLIALPFIVWGTLDLLDRLYIWRFHPADRRP